MDDQLNIPSVTGTDLTFDVAGPGGRSYAFIIDWHIRLLVALAYFLAATLSYTGTVSWFDDVDNALTGYFYFVSLPAMIIYFFYHPVLEILMDGRTPGKRIAGVRVVTADGQSPGVGAHLVRNIFRLVDSLPIAYVIGITTTLFTKNNVRLGDLAAGTLLIYDHADEKAALKDVEAVSGSDVGLERAELVQELIERWGSLDSATRFNLGRKLLSQMGNDLPPVLDDNDILLRLKAHINV